MVSQLLTKYISFALCAQISLSIVNCLFVLNSGDAVLPVIAFYGIFQRLPLVLMFFAMMEALSIAMDVVRLVLWSRFILNEILQVPATLGTFYLVLTVFQTVVKLVCLIFSLMIRREIIEYLRDPQKNSTVHRANNFLAFVPSFIGGDRSIVSEQSPLLKKAENVDSFERLRNRKDLGKKLKGNEDESNDFRILKEEDDTSKKSAPVAVDKRFQYESFSSGSQGALKE